MHGYYLIIVGVRIVLIYIGKTESTADKLRSVLAQLEFSYRIRHYHDIVGVPFRYHLYVPEAHTITNLPICEREDEGHVFKVSNVL